MRTYNAKDILKNFREISYLLPIESIKTKQINEKGKIKIIKQMDKTKIEGLSTSHMEDYHEEKNQVWSKEVINDLAQCNKLVGST